MHKLLMEKFIVHWLGLSFKMYTCCFMLIWTLTGILITAVSFSKKINVIVILIYFTIFSLLYCFKREMA